MLARILCWFALSSGSLSLYAQSLPLPADTAAYFDFWLGEWEATWTEGDGQGHGRNQLQRVLNGKVIKENFAILGGQSAGFKGESWTVYQPRSQSWHQTWVDNQGGYLVFNGRFEANKRIFQTTPRTLPDGEEVIQRMVFRDIQADRFTWDWESSRDGGRSWQLQWRINYLRKASE